MKKIILSCLVFILLAFSFAPSVYAQTNTGTWYSQPFSEWFAKVNESPENEIFGERYTAAQVQWVIYGLFYFVINSATNGNASALSCLMTSTDIGACRDAIENLKDSFPGTGNSNINSDLSLNNPLLRTISTNPISLSAYLKDVGERLQIVPKASAQTGFGFGAANPALTLWKISRNLAYSFLIVVIVVMAFMIMFRVKISPQTVISVQSALPKIVIALILITFSYAIAGLLIDFMYVVIGLISAFLVSGSTPISSWNWSQMFTALTTGRDVFWLFMAYWFQFFAAAFLNIFSASIFTSFFVLIFAILAFFILIWYSIKVIIVLLKTYIQIMLLIIVGPILILMGTVSPNAGFGSWLKSMLANLAVYPLIGLMFVLALLFVRAGLPDWWPAFLTPFDINTGFFQGAAWDPPLTFGTGGAGTNKLLWVLVSYGIIVLIPKTVEIIQGFISGKPFPYGTAIGEAFGPAKYGATTYGFRVAETLERGGELPRPLGFLKRVIPEDYRRPVGKALETFLKGQRR
ncbi:MAG: hypothetical protein AAB875_03665 [Patescibacteria group bacterium]